MKVLVIGNGGREHALCVEISAISIVDQRLCAPGNAGTYREPKVENIAIDPFSFQR